MRSANKAYTCALLRYLQILAWHLRECIRLRVQPFTLLCCASSGYLVCVPIQRSISRQVQGFRHSQGQETLDDPSIHSILPRNFRRTSNKNPTSWWSAWSAWSRLGPKKCSSIEPTTDIRISAPQLPLLSYGSQRVSDLGEPTFFWWPGPPTGPSRRLHCLGNSCPAWEGSGKKAEYA